MWILFYLYLEAEDCRRTYDFLTVMVMDVKGLLYFQLVTKNPRYLDIFPPSLLTWGALSSSKYLSGKGRKVSADFVIYKSAIWKWLTQRFTMQKKLQPWFHRRQLNWSNVPEKKIKRLFYEDHFILKQFFNKFKGKPRIWRQSHWY